MPTSKIQLIKNLQPLSYENGTCGVLGCIDPRLAFLNLSLAQGLYPNQAISCFTCAGAVKALNEQEQLYITNLDVMVNTLQIRNFLILNHLDCKAYNIRMGYYDEIRFHVEELNKAAKFIVNRYRELKLNISAACIPCIPGQNPEQIEGVLIVGNYTCEESKSFSCV